jgi:hypothetical protein
MTEPDEIQAIGVEDELRACPSCGYDRGFHVSFQNLNARTGEPVKSTRDVYRIVLICPECGARFDIGWKVPIVPQ